MADVMTEPVRHTGTAATTGHPRVSIVMANYNGARFIEAALRSALAQTQPSLEVIVVDDASTDDSLVRIASVMASDDRVTLLRQPRNTGAASARNRALDIAAGDWIAVMDSDDLMHPDRLARLLRAAEGSGADIVADDLLVFDDADIAPPTAMIGRAETRWIGIAAYVRANALEGPGPALGYLKPMFRRDCIAAPALRYDASLPIAEDYAFVLALLARGARFQIVPELTYFYRKHSRSLSHRMSGAALQAMLAADRAGLPAMPSAEPGLEDALAYRRRTIETALAFDTLVTAIKERRWMDAARTAATSPRALALLRVPLRDRLRRAMQMRSATTAAPDAPSTRPSICLISRQRVVGAVNGSSAYLLSLCTALRDSGFDVHLVSPSPTVFGSWPVLMLRPEMSVFRSIRVRGAWRIGGLLVASDPTVMLRAAKFMASRLLARIGLGFQVAKAPYAIAVQWQTDDFLFVARHARRHADALLADYAFLTEGLPYALRPEAPSGVVMHDLFCSHAAPAPSRPAPLVRIDCAAEMALLGGAGAVIAIQLEEAAAVASHLPGQRVILAPMAAFPVAVQQPGIARSCLFVGSNTEPNIKGLEWFLAEVWPKVRAAVPDAVLDVAGGVASGVGMRPAGVRFLGLVKDLAPHYRDAGVVISPLRFGSGLKIKLVEALAQGKATVVTSVTLQGVEAIADGAVICADEADGFAAGVIRLMQDTQARSDLCGAALAVAREHFAPGPCYQALTTFFADNIHAKRVGAP